MKPIFFTMVKENKMRKLEEILNLPDSREIAKQELEKKQPKKFKYPVRTLQEFVNGISGN